MDATMGEVARTGPVRYRVIGQVAVLALSSPPVNALSGAVRSALSDCLARAEADDRVRAVVLTGSARLFSAGADIGEFDQTPALPRLADLCTRIEALHKPVIVALRGVVLGGGLELALAAHYRLADAGARFGAPEVSLGLLPGAGGTQRLPRLIGAEQALHLMLGGRTVTAVQALAMGLLDRVVETRLLAIALRFAASGPDPRPTLAQRGGLRDAPAYLAAVARARTAQTRNPVPAARRIVDCVEAAQLLPADQALAVERHAFEDLLASPESLALRHLFRAERRAARPPAAVVAQRQPQVHRLAILGAGIDSADLVTRALRAGLHVTLADAARDRMTACLHRIAETAEAEVAAGRRTPEARDDDWARLTSVLSPHGLAEADLILTDGAAGPPPAGMAHLPCLHLGGLAQTDSTGVALACGPHGLNEVAVGRSAPPALVATALALARRLSGPVVLVGPGGAVFTRLRGVLEAVFEHLRAASTPPDQLAALQGAFAADAPAHPRGLDRLLRLTHAALANEGARLFAHRAVRHPSDIDCIMVLSGLMPRWSGGPMHQADRRGLLLVRADLQAQTETAPHLFAPAALFDTLIAEGRRFDTLNR